MALPSNDKIIGDLGHTADHNAIVDEITFIKDNYFSASSSNVNLPEYLRSDTASVIYATIISPEFTGTPIAPTAASGTNTTQIATTAFVRSEITALVDSAPETLDTLNELAAALGDNPNFIVTVSASLSNKLDSSTASSLYLTQTDAENTYFPKSASGGLLTEEEASVIYLRQDSASSVYLTSSDADNLYFPNSASGILLTESEASNVYLRQDSASATYLPISASSSLAPIGYLTEASASSIYLTQTDASNIYFPISSSSTLSPIGYLTASAAADIYAPLISPNFSGTPTAPNPTLGANNNEIATTAFVADAILAVQTGSAVDLSEYLRADTASALYLSSNDIIDGGAP